MARRTRNIDSQLRNRRAFTLAESLIASVVLAVAVVAVSGSIIASQQQTEISQDDSFAISLARQLIEEIASCPLTYPDSTAGFPTVTNRSLYDAINDFSGYTDRVSNKVYFTSTLSAAGSFNSAAPNSTVITSGTPTPGNGEYIRTVTITYPTTIFGKTTAAADFSVGDFAIVKVNVKGSNGADVTLSRIMSKTTVVR